MTRSRAGKAHPQFTLLDHLQVLFVSFCPCLCVGARPATPPTSPGSSAELDALLDAEDDNDRTDAVSLHSQYGQGRGRQKAPSKVKKVSIGGFWLFGRREVPQSYDVEDEASTSALSLQDGDEHDDAQEVCTETLSNLPEIARKWEPSVTLKDLQAEEARLEEMERKAERAGGLDIYSSPRVGSTSGAGGDDDFGDFTTAPSLKLAGDARSAGDAHLTTDASSELASVDTRGSSSHTEASALREGLRTFSQHVRWANVMRC